MKRKEKRRTKVNWMDDRLVWRREGEVMDSWERVKEASGGDKEGGRTV